jgi:hypothetical protein
MQAACDVRAYVAAVMPDCAPELITAVSGLDAGENHDVYRLSYLGPAGDKRDVVTRIATSEYARECATAEREAAVLRKVDGFGAPKLYDFRCESEWFSGMGISGVAANGGRWKRARNEFDAGSR